MVRTTDWDNELLEAARIGFLIKVQTALEKGANPNAKDNYGSTPLQTQQLEVMLRLLRSCLSVVLIRGLPTMGGIFP